MDSYIQHHGVKGMKWGIRRAERRAQKQAIKIQKEDLKKSRSEHKLRMKNQKTARKIDTFNRKKVINSRKYADKNRSLLTDDELRKRVGRLQLERQLHSLTQEQIHPNRAIAKDLIKTAASRTVTNIAVDPLTKAGGKRVSSMLAS